MSAGQTLVYFTPQMVEPPATNAALLDTRNARPLLAFDATTAWSAVFTGILPRSYASGGLTVTVVWCAASATTGNINWQGAFERSQDGADTAASDSFAAVQSSGSTATPGTAGVIKYTTIAFTNGAQMDSVADGEAFRFKLTRDTTVGSNLSGNAQVLAIEIRESP